MTVKTVLFAPYENLKGFTQSRPPVVVFLLCLGLLAVVLMSLAYFIKMNEITNRDISRDWNTFLTSFESLEYCIQNTSDPAPYTQTSTSATTSATSNLLTTSDSYVDDEQTRNYSVSMLVTVTPTLSFVSIPHNITQLYGSLYGAELGLSGAAADEMIHLSIQLPFEWNATQCHLANSRCPPVQILTCLSLQGSSRVFPRSRHDPELCQNQNDTGVEHRMAVYGHRPHAYSRYHCSSKPRMKLQYKLDQTLNVYLSLADKSLINLHLLHTSYFLFVMAVTILLYAIIRGRPQGYKVVSQQPLLMEQL